MTGEELRRKLSPMGKNAAQWAELIGVSEKTIYRMYKAEDVRTEMLERLCKALEKPITFFYDTDGGNEDKDSNEGKGAANASIIRIKKSEAQSDPQPKSVPVDRTFNLDKKVSELLAARHRKMSDLARHMEVTYPTVVRMCSNNSCSLASLVKMADFFKVPVTFFLPTDLRAIEEEKKYRQIHFLKGQIDVYQKTLSTLLCGESNAGANPF